ncbi:CGP-CTERM sorting domain-containing protein [Thermococcus sp. M39]|uniref:ABC transporter substrate-binding protein n=1 Tax=Thermococcus sp. M39 TaxID=1638262 RepID=UPI001438CD46|nr:ABC transporter substrate-binding protein [Thermococcus sp. M39]NJE08679.1 CGP-CTERM sorting domain-containing protein [Thermococcus sp. M39]
MKALKNVLLALFLAGLVATPAALASPDIELVLATRQWKTFNPLTSSTVYANVVLDKIYEPLIRWDDSGFKLVGALAEKWEFKTEGDKKILTFYLRKDAKWHDGKGVTADDVKYTLELFQSDPAKFVNPDPLILKGLKEIKVVDKYTIQLIYDANEAPADTFLEMAFTTLFIVPKHIWTNKSIIPDPTASLDKPEQLIGCGPFKVVEIKPDEYVKLEAFPDHYLGKPEVNKVIFKMIKDRNQFAMMVAAGELDAGYHYFFGKYLEEFKKMVANDPNVQIYRTASKSIHLLAFNFNKGFPYNNLEFRKAIAYALPVDKIVQKYYGADGAVLGSMGFLGPFFGSFAEYLPKEKLYPYDPEKAKQILDQLGFKDINGDGYRETPDGKPFEIYLLTRAPGDSFFRDAIGDEIAHYLEEVGLKVTVDKAGDYWDKWGAGSWDMAIVGFVPHKPTDLAWFTTGNPGNRVGYSNSEFDKLFDEFQKTGDPKLAYKLEETLANDVVFIALYHPVVATPYRIDHYRGWKPNPRDYTVGYWSLIGSPTKVIKETEVITTTTKEKEVITTTVEKKETVTATQTVEKGVCGPAAIVGLALLPLLALRRRR